MSLRNLTEWHDWDDAEYELGIRLGLFDRERHPFQTKAKHVFWSNNPVGNALHKCLDAFVEAKILERRPEDDLKFRWNKDFVGSWEYENNAE